VTIVTTVTKSVVHRAWTDLEPKLIAFLATGLTATALVSAADYVGLKLPEGLASLIVLIVAGIAGYVKSSTSKVPPVAAAVVTPAPVEVPAVTPAPVVPLEVAVAPVVGA
jgi:hypothetical protein